MTLNIQTLRTAYRDRVEPRRLLGAAGRLGLRIFAAAATGSVILLVTVHIVFSDIPINYETPVFGVLEPTAVIAGLTVMLPAVVLLSLARLAARRRDWSRHLATLTVVLFIPFVSLSANISDATYWWVAYTVVYLILAAVLLPAVTASAWVLDATARPATAEEGR